MKAFKMEKKCPSIKKEKEKSSGIDRKQSKAIYKAQ